MPKPTLKFILYSLLMQMPGISCTNQNPKTNDITIGKYPDNLSDSLTTRLTARDRVEIFGGYDNEPLYLKNPRSAARTGVVTRFIKGQNGDSAVVKLDHKIVGDSISGDQLVLELRYEGQTWFTTGPVHIELCNFEPENKAWKDRRKGEWVEAAASFKIIK